MYKWYILHIPTNFIIWSLTDEYSIKEYSHHTWFVASDSKCSAISDVHCRKNACTIYTYLWDTKEQAITVLDSLFYERDKIRFDPWEGVQLEYTHKNEFELVKVKI